MNGPREQPEMWLSKWMKEESFWRGIIANVFSGLILAVLIWGIGLAFGIFNPVHQTSLTNWAVEAICFLLLTGAFVATLRFSIRNWRHSFLESNFLISGGLAILILAALVMVGQFVIHDTAVLFFGATPGAN